MIRIDLTIDSRVINTAALEEIKEIKERIRREMLAFIFHAVDGVTDDRGYRFSHVDVQVDGTIKVENRG